MGNGASFQDKRKTLRESLVVSYLRDPKNKGILTNIATLKKILTNNHDICATAAREQAQVFEPTCTASAQLEFERLLRIYEDHMSRKSVLKRTRSIACPLGHCLEPRDKGRCFLCRHNGPTDFFGCDYCDYELCQPCTIIYCFNGHKMKLWTHPESQHHCSICKEVPITSGYMCLICSECNICDFCTSRNGRLAVQGSLRAEINELASYFESKKNVSTIAEQALHRYYKEEEEASGYFSIPNLTKRREVFKKLKEGTIAEVETYKLIEDVKRLRQIVARDAGLSASARRESFVPMVYSTQEIQRLLQVVSVGEAEKSVVSRAPCVVACPLGHAALKFDEKLTVRPSAEGGGVLQIDVGPLPPEGVISRDRALRRAVCRVCDRGCPAGFHCRLCEYDICPTCSTQYCAEGHEMTIWTEPQATGQQCFLCGAGELTMGYNCPTCVTNLCDRCTTREARGQVRRQWEAERDGLVAFMKENKYYSDIAKEYAWPKIHYITSPKALIAYVRELQVAQKKVIKQVKYKKIIEKIKAVRVELIRDAKLSKCAAAEEAREQTFVFQTKREALQELERMQTLLAEDLEAKGEGLRLRNGFACPLGHGTVLLRPARRKWMNPSPSTLRSTGLGSVSERSSQDFTVAALPGFIRESDTIARKLDYIDHQIVGVNGAQSMNDGATVESSDEGRNYCLSHHKLIEDQSEIAVNDGRFLSTPSHPIGNRYCQTGLLSADSSPSPTNRLALLPTHTQPGGALGHQRPAQSASGRGQDTDRARVRMQKFEVLASTDELFDLTCRVCGDAAVSPPRSREAQGWALLCHL